MQSGSLASSLYTLPNITLVLLCNQDYSDMLGRVEAGHAWKGRSGT